MKKGILIAAMALAALGAQAQSDNGTVTSVPISSDFTYGVTLGVGGMWPTGDLSDNFKGSAIFEGNLLFGYDDFRLKTGFQYGQPSVKNSNIFDAHDAAGHPTEGNAHADPTFWCWNLQLGYKVYQGHRLSVTPNVGVAYTRYNWDIDKLEWSKNDQDEDQYTVTGTRKAHLGHWGVMASVDFDVRLHTTITDTPFLGSGYKRFVSAIRVTPWVAYAKYKSAPEAKGCLVGFTVSYAGLLQSITR